MLARRLSLGVLTLLAACATGKEQQQQAQPPKAEQVAQQAPPQPPSREQRVEQAQEEAARAFEQARAAQERAIQLQREAAKAQQRVEELERRFAEAEQRLSAARHEARQRGSEAIEAQQRARLEAERAQSAAAESQRLALDLQRNRLTVVGELAAIGPDLIIIRGPDPQPLRLGIGERTTVTMDGERVSPDELFPGTEVRATYQIIDGRPIAVQIEALPSPLR